MERNVIINGKSEDVVKSLEDNSVNLIVTSPPYNVDLENTKIKNIFNDGRKKFGTKNIYSKETYSSPRGGYDVYNDNRKHVDYIYDLKLLFSRVKSKLTDDARIVINISDHKNGEIPVASEIIQFMTKELNYLFFTTIIWNKNIVSNRLSWGSFNSPSKPSFPTPFEYILIFSNKSRKLLHKGISDLDPKEFVKWTFAIWEFKPETKWREYEHTAMFPEELPLRCIKLLSYKGDLVLDPFCGTGTTCAVAKKLERDFIGIELSEKYTESAKLRCENIRGKKELECFFNF